MFISEGYSCFQTLTLIDFIAQLVMVWTLPYFNFHKVSIVKKGIG